MPAFCFGFLDRLAFWLFDPNELRKPPKTIVPWRACSAGAPKGQGRRRPLRFLQEALAAAVTLAAASAEEADHGGAYLDGRLLEQLAIIEAVGQRAEVIRQAIVVGVSLNPILYGWAAEAELPHLFRFGRLWTLSILLRRLLALGLEGDVR